MAVYVLDTSALVKYYHTEPGEQTVVALIDGPGNRLLISHLTYVEWHSVFARHTRTGVISADEFRLLRGHFYADLRTRKFQIIPTQGAHLQRAARLLSTHALTQNLRTLDALQLAIALDLRQRIPFDHFVCADASFCRVARLEGLSVLNPETA